MDTLTGNIVASTGRLGVCGGLWDIIVHSKKPERPIELAFHEESDFVQFDITWDELQSLSDTLLGVLKGAPKSP